MANIWNDITKWLDEASKVIGKEAGDLTLKGRLKLEIFELKRKLRDLFSELGTLVFNEVFIRKNSDWIKNKKIAAIVKKIKGTQRIVKKKELEFKKVGKQKKKK